MSFNQLIILMCAFLWLTLLGMHSVPAMLPLFTNLWSLTYTEAGWLAGINTLPIYSEWPLSGSPTGSTPNDF